MQWLNQNSGAVQAGMAVIIGFLTIALIAVTGWYAVLTRRMAETMERQLAASFQPNIELNLLNRFAGSKDISGTVVVSNKGDMPVKIVAVAMRVVFENAAFSDQLHSWDALQRIVAPGKVTEFPHLTLDVPIGSTVGKYKRFAQIHCSDLAGISKHTFSFCTDNEKIINQAIGFQPIENAIIK